MCVDAPNGVRTAMGRACTCPKGLVFVDEDCQDVDACTAVPCDPNAAGCTDLPPPADISKSGRTCDGCISGFEGDGETCTGTPDHLKKYLQLSALNTTALLERWVGTLANSFNCNPLSCCCLKGPVTISDAQNNQVRISADLVGCEGITRFVALGDLTERQVTFTRDGVDLSCESNGAGSSILCTFARTGCKTLLSNAAEGNGHGNSFDGLFAT